MRDELATRIMMCLSVAFVTLSVALVGCGQDGSGPTNDGATGSDASGLQDGFVPPDSFIPPDGWVPPDGYVPPDAGWYNPVCQETRCQGEFLYACGNCLDDDEDGLIDSQDPDCLGPCDNNEAGFNTLIPGGNAQPCMADCYFDKDSGAGNDQCYWDLRCDPLQPQAVMTCNYSIPCGDCQCSEWLASQGTTCLSYCLPLVPNGCDCFGCCALDAEGVDYRFIGSPGCGPGSIESCDPCTPNPACINECGHCEICLGRTELPPDCYGVQECPSNQQPCGQPGDDPCPANTYCITGCCVPVVN